jgi:hypothetical protein
MSDTLRKHMSRDHAARPSTIQYLVKREEMMERLRQELTRSYQREAENRMQPRRWSLLAWLMGR